MKHINTFYQHINEFKSLFEGEVTHSQFINGTQGGWILMTDQELEMLDGLKEYIGAGHFDEDKYDGKSRFIFLPWEIKGYHNPGEEIDYRWHLHLGEDLRIAVGKISTNLWTVVSEDITTNGNHSSYETKYYLESSLQEAIGVVASIGGPEITWIQMR